MTGAAQSVAYPDPQPIRVFIAYAREDQDYRNTLVKALADMQRQRIVELWADHRLVAGEPWDQAIRNRLVSAQVFIFLMSIDSIASEYIDSVEIQQALTRQLKGEAHVFPVIVRRCDWRSSRLGELQAVPRSGKSVREYDDPDAFWLDVRTELKVVIEHLRQRTWTTPPSVSKEELTATSPAQTGEKNDTTGPVPFDSLMGQLEKTMSNPRYSSDLKSVEANWDLSTIMDRETILIVVGCFFMAELFDRPVADALRDQIDMRGAHIGHRRAIVITDAEWKGNAGLQNGHPVIAIGGPVANALTKEMSESALADDKWTDGRLSRVFLGGPLPRVAIWGPEATDTRRSSERYLQQPDGLEHFLKLCWK